MKTEQEQIKAIKQIIDERVETTLGYVQGRHGNVIKTVDTIIIARDIVEAGYGDVSEYKAEIERLRQEVRDTDKIARNTIEQYKNNYDNAFERLKAQEREIERLKADYAKLQEQFAQYQMASDKEIKAQIKQAQIDVLKKLRSRISDKEALIQSYIADGCLTIEDMYTEIDELIEEVQNGEDKG